MKNAKKWLLHKESMNIQCKSKFCVFFLAFAAFTFRYRSIRVGISIEIIMVFTHTHTHKRKRNSEKREIDTIIPKNEKQLIQTEEKKKNAWRNDEYGT